MHSCSLCRAPVAVSEGNWPFVYSQVLIHLQVCSPGVPSDRLKHEATELTDAVVQDSFRALA